jgi:mono/diheme cytochrome c family protein
MKKLLTLTVVLLAGLGWTASANDAKALYDKQCAKCHGADGKGNTKMGKKEGVKDYTDPKVQAELTDERAFKSIKEGIKDGNKVVKKPAENLTDAEIKALVKYMRTFKK